ncbi:hypothetical protein ACET3Z_016830 [Daucus carota]
MADQTPQHLTGCGFVGSIFQRKAFVRPRSASTPPLPAIKDATAARHSTSSIKHSRDHSIKIKRRRASSGDSTYLDSTIIAAAAKPPPPPKHTKTPSQKPPPPPPPVSVSPRHSRNKTSDSSRDQLPYTKWLKKEPTFTESELSMRIAVRQKSTPTGGILYRASSNNGMLPSHLGNLKQQGGGAKASSGKTSANSHVTSSSKGGRSIYTPMLMGNIVKKPSGKTKAQYRFDSETLKLMGNENYKEGRYEEAIALYQEAIAQDPSKASYYSNKSAALIGLGRLIEAVFDCRVAIRIYPMYQRAHQRLAKLYLRLGDADKALSHYKQLGAKADAIEVSLAEALKMHLTKTKEARTVRDWESVEEESHLAISSGADSSPQIYALKAEALLNLGKHQEAYTIIQKGPNYDTNLCIQFLGATGCSDLLTTKAQVYMAAGRFEEAVAAAQCAAKLDPTEEAKATAERALALASARSEGNQLFKASKFTDALKVYSEGLQHQALNSVLLCNRAACLSKLNEYEKAVEDCTAALALRPSYAKARLRRADCFSKLERWEASIQDYEIMLKENPKDRDVEKALYVAQVHAQKQLSEDIRNMKNNASSNLVMISSKEHFRRFVIAPGMSVVLFCNKSSHVKLFQLMEQVCLRFPSVNFLKVEIEDNPYIMQLEDVNSVPAFKIYKNGSTIKEISGENFESLESSVKMISCTPYN